jgi:predicted dehydrogenase
MLTLTAAIAGTGFGNEHARVYRETDGIELIALAEPDEARRGRFVADHPGIAGHASLDRLLADGPPDILSICTPHYLHAPLTISAAEAGVRAVYVEKPMAMHLGEADEMIAACRQHGTLLVVGHQRRLGPAARAARAVIDEGRLGSVSLVHTTWGYGPLDWEYAFSGGGPLMYLGIHSLDLFRFLVGDIASVQGRLQRRNTRSIESQAKAFMRTVSGIPVILETGEGIDGCVTEILFTQGRLRLNDHRVSIRAHGSAWKDLPLDLPAGVPADRAWLHPLRAMIDGIVHSLATDAPHPVSHPEGRAALELAMAIYESHRIGGIVELPFSGRGSPLQRMIEEETL